MNAMSPQMGAELHEVALAIDADQGDPSSGSNWGGQGLLCRWRFG